MTITTGEIFRRRFLGRLFASEKERGAIIEVDEKALIRQRALEAFQQRLDAKLKNMQTGEHLLVRFEIEIVTASGKVRGGSGAERNMPEYIQWRKRVFERDDYTCRHCGVRGRLEAHHVKPWSLYPEARFDVNNGQTLCASCHAQQHPHLKLHR